MVRMDKNNVHSRYVHSITRVFGFYVKYQFGRLENFTCGQG